ncbi:MAG: hypothetical protein KDA21_13185 [Phycisphaerales bacterium]|nr:hypothetical protein [Phycisphaerales bacterium]
MTRHTDTPCRHASGLAIVLALVAAAGIPSGCRSTSEPEATDPRATGENRVADVATESVPRRDPESFGPTPTPDLEPEPEPAVAEPVTDAAPASPDEVVPTTGRPGWWFAEVERGDGRLTLCVEVLGPTMLEVRRGVLDVARARLRDELGLAPDAPIPGETVERLSTTPLAARSGDVRYAGYAMMSAASP